MVTNIAYPSISTSGLTVFLDAGYTPSYCRTGSVWNDLSGNNNLATLFNSPTFSLNSGGVFVFNGANMYASGSLSSLSTFTFGVWVSVSTLEENAGILSSTNSAGIRIVNNGFQFFNATASGTTISTNTWYYVVGTQDATTQKLYVNGSLVSSASSTTTVSGTFFVSKSFDEIYLDSTLGCVQIYNRALSPSEISNNYLVQYTRYTTPPSYTIIITQDGIDMAAQNGDILIT
jgi:hypothetical protein